MRSLLLAVLAAYLNAAIHSILAFVNKRRSLQRVAEWSIAAGFILHTAALVADWVIDGHYPLFSLREALSFLAWALVAVYSIALYRYRAQAVGAFTMPLISVLTLFAFLIGGNSPNAPANFSATWLFPVHTTLLIFAYAAFFIVFMASVMYLLQERVRRHLSPPPITDDRKRTGNQRCCPWSFVADTWNRYRRNVVVVTFWPVLAQRSEGNFRVTNMDTLFRPDDLSNDGQLARTQCGLAGRRRICTCATDVFWNEVSR
jgi:hypothetical protein